MFPLIIRKQRRRQQQQLLSINFSLLWHRVNVDVTENEVRKSALMLSVLLLSHWLFFSDCSVVLLYCTIVWRQEVTKL